jgi:F-type H+-transporting ATPase subunit epsilon
MPLTLEIVTPEARLYSDTIDTVVIPTHEGEIGVLPGHIPLLAQVDHGELRVTKGGATQVLAVSGGFVQIIADKVSVLAESAIQEEKIDEHAAEEAMKRAEDALKGKATLEPAEVERLEGIVRFSTTQLSVRRRRR